MEYKMNNIKYLEHISAVPGREMILARIGYKKDKTVLDERNTKMIDEGIRTGELLCNVRGAYGRFGIVDRSESHIKLMNGVIFKSENLSKLLSMSSEVVLMASTAGKDVVERISREINSGNAAFGVILDSVASQTADAGLNWLSNFLNKILSREGRKLTKHRYSPGFGDLPLSYQRVIFELLGLGKLDMELTDSFMLMPEKSVIAIAGVEEA
ncbi:MAG: methionine synthase [Clostridia bacterium]|nr:methionine synthase [Clostridia bacterium]